MQFGGSQESGSHQGAEGRPLAAKSRACQLTGFQFLDKQFLDK
jgi:hypothetical protein